jgi:hypothetical protein
MSEEVLCLLEEVVLIVKTEMIDTDLIEDMANLLDSMTEREDSTIEEGKSRSI